MKKAICLVLILSCVAAFAAVELKEKQLALQKRMIFQEDGLIGFSDDGLIIGLFKVDHNGNGALVTRCQTGNGVQKMIIRNVSVEAGGFKCDLLNWETKEKEGVCTGEVTGFTLQVICRASDDSYRSVFKLVPAKEVMTLFSTCEKLKTE